MWIERITLNNFRSIGYPGIELFPIRGLNTIVGANNVGKSSIFAALDAMWAGRTFAARDQHWGSTAAIRPSQVKFGLDAGEVDIIFNRLTRQWRAGIDEHPEGASKFKGWLQDTKITYQINPWVLQIDKYMTTNQQMYTGNGNQIEPSTLVSRLDNEQLEDVFNTIELVNFGDNLLPAFRETLAPNFRIFSDVRTRPRGVGGPGGAEVKDSYEGGSTTDFLMNLWHGEPHERSTFESIKSHFSAFFPGWTFTITGQQGSPQNLVFNKDGHGFDIPQENVGTGVVEVLTFIANLEGKSGNVLVLEEPELHLHPQSQRALQHLIIQSSERNQIFVLTHSPFFVDPNYLLGLSRMWMPDDRSRIAKFPDHLPGRELASLRESFADLRRREMLSSRATLLVEGETEEAFLQSVGPRINLDPDANGVTVISVHGQGSYTPYMRMLEKMEIPYLCHRDLSPGIPRRYKSHFRVIGAEFEEYFKKQGLGHLVEEAERTVGTNKVRMGRYLGVHIAPEKVPTKFVEILEEIIQVAGNRAVED